MRTGLHVTAIVLGLFGACGSARAEVLIRWDRDEIPSSTSLGISAVVVPATNRTAMRSARAGGYRVYLELDGTALARFVPPGSGIAGVVVRGTPSSVQLARLERRLEAQGAHVLLLEERGKWPHIRSNLIVRNGEVLQVSSRSAQPWIESNAALLRITRGTHPARPPMLTYAWDPNALTAITKDPALEDYLVAIAEAGSFAGGLLLPLHESFQRDLLLGKPRARAEWNEIRRYLEFYSWGLAGRYRPVANIGVATADPMSWFEVMNLLLRHNLPFEVIHPSRLPAADLSSLDLLIVLEPPKDAQVEELSRFARNGGAVVLAGRQEALSSGRPMPWRGATPVGSSEDRITYEVGTGRVTELQKGVLDPDRFALEIRQMLGRERRVIDIWNGITVLAAAYDDPDGQTLLVTTLNYAHQGLPVQLRVRGVFREVQYESPEEPAGLLPHHHRNGHTEFVLPSLRIGARIFLGGREE